MGANAPTEFYGGSTVFMQQTNAISLARDLAKEIGGVKTFNISLVRNTGLKIFGPGQAKNLPGKTMILQAEHKGALSRYQVLIPWMW